MLVADLRTWRISPSKVCPGKASTVKLAFCPVRRRPTSLSSMLASTCMSCRFWAITNSSGACKLAATVWPFSMARLMTMPFTGEVMRVRSRSTRAWASAASRCATLARAELTCASVTPSWACAAFSASAEVFTSALVLSDSLCAIKPLLTSIRLRSWVRRASARSVCARDTWAWLAATLACAVSTMARAASTSAWAERTRYSNVSGSMRASNCPAFTSSLKSANRSRICPLTCVPTDTCDTGFTAPLAATLACKLPRTMAAVRYCTPSLAARCIHHQAPVPTSTSATPAAIAYFLFIVRF